MASYEATDGGRPRTRTMQSSESKQSHKSRRSNSSNKLDLIESPRDKLRIHGKTDPTAAISEAQPAAVALEKPTLGDLRRGSYLGRDGQPIMEPDSSNPTRSRWERPLDTIKSFQDDIDRTYKEKQINNPPTRPQSRGDMYGRAANRRSSYFSAYNQPSPGGYYGNGYENGAGEDYQQYQGNNAQAQTGYAPNNYGPNAYGSNGYGAGNMNRGPSARFSRGYSEPLTSTNGATGDRQPNQPSQPNHNYHQSRETVTSSMAFSFDTDNQAYSTNPSSQNSSMDQFGATPVPPPKFSNQAAPPARATMKLDTGVDSNGGFENFDASPKDKRKSWLRRRFSKD